MRLWTIQSRDVLDKINETGVWVPDFRFSKYPKLVPGFEELYDFVLMASNRNNHRQDRGLVFCFMKIIGDEIKPIGSIDSFMNFLNDNAADLRALLDVILNSDSVIMELEVDLGPFFPTLIELNDWNLMAHGVDLPPYPMGYIDNLKNEIMRKRITVTEFVHTNVMQAHIPFIRSKDIVNVYTI